MEGTYFSGLPLDMYYLRKRSLQEKKIFFSAMFPLDSMESDFKDL